MRYQLVVFDLDGTLLNTLEDLTGATNHALALYGYPPRSADEVRRFVGNGVVRLMRRALPGDVPEETFERALSAFREYYARNVNARTRPYDGIPELLAKLRAKGVRVAVNSNKPDAATNALCEAHFGGFIDMALGERDGIPKKPAPDGVRRILDALGIAAERALYVGDGDADILTAANAGMDCAWVSWGFRRRDELQGLAIPHAFDTPDALGKHILDA